MATIIPTVMPESREDFEDKIHAVCKFVDTIQIDVMDGKFVPSISWPYNNESDEYWSDLKKQEQGLPYWDKIDYEIDLMVEDQIEEATNWINAGVKRIIGHVEAFSSDEMIREFIELGRGYQVEVYLALAPSTDLGRVRKWINPEDENYAIDGVQFMGIENVGYQGQPFAEGIIKSISELRAEFPDIHISVDGGVNDETATELIEAGATNLASGSYIFNSGDPKGAIDHLKSI